MYYIQYTNEYFFQKYYTLPVSGFRGGLVLCPGARVSRAATPRTCPLIPRGGGTRAVCLTPGYQSRQTYGLPHTIPPPEAAEPPRLTNAPPRNCHYVSETPLLIFGTVVVSCLPSSWIKMIRDARNKQK